MEVEEEEEKKEGDGEVDIGSEVGGWTSGLGCDVVALAKS